MKSTPHTDCPSKASVRTGFPKTGPAALSVVGWTLDQCLSQRLPCEIHSHWPGMNHLTKPPCWGWRERQRERAPQMTRPPRAEVLTFPGLKVSWESLYDQPGPRVHAGGHV